MCPPLSSEVRLLTPSHYSVGGRHCRRRRIALLLPHRGYMLVALPPQKKMSPRSRMLTVSIAADPISLIHSIHARNMKAGVAISPDTPSTSISDEVGELADMLLVMTVYPGIYSTPLYGTTEREHSQDVAGRNL
jgi:Ribulose-phosphate 3 epimerase family